MSPEGQTSLQVDNHCAKAIPAESPPWKPGIPISQKAPVCKKIKRLLNAGLPDHKLGGRYAGGTKERVRRVSGVVELEQWQLHTMD